MKNIKLTKDKFIDIACILLGSFLAAISINMFLTHAKLLSGGLSGICLIFQYLFKIQAGYLILLLNLPLFLISTKKINKRFTMYSAIGTLSLSIFLILTHPIANILNINDKLLYCLYGGVVNGLAFGLIFSHHGSTGGLDIISMLIKLRYPQYDIAKISFASNTVIVTISAIIFGLPTALYTLIAMYITSFVFDKVVKGFNQSKSVIIITDFPEKISSAVMKELNRGVTYFYGEGVYKKEDKKILFCIVPLSQLPELKQIVREIDKSSFITISDVSEIQGKGFVASL